MLLEKCKEISYGKIYSEAKKHIIDCTANLTVSNPIAAGLETFFAGMTDEISFNARLISAVMAYAGMGSIVSRGRDIYRKAIHITNKTKEKTQVIHDALYFALANLVLAPVIYRISGTTDIKEIALGTLSCIGIGSTIGPAVGYSISGFRDLAGIEKCERLPKRIQNLRDNTKKGLAILITVGSILATWGVYELTPDKEIKLQIEIPTSAIPETKHNLENVLSEFNPTNPSLL